MFGLPGSAVYVLYLAFSAVIFTRIVFEVLQDLVQCLGFDVRWTSMSFSSLFKHRTSLGSCCMPYRLICVLKVVRDPCQKITLLLLKSKSVRVIVPESCF